MMPLRLLIPTSGLAGLIASAALVLSACAPLPTAEDPGTAPPTSRPSPSERAPVTDRPSSPGVPGSRPAPRTIEPPAPTHAAVAGLLAQAWRRHESGDNDAAIAVAERAQRLDPRNPEAYLILASSYLAQAENTLAEQLARRGIALSAPGSTMRRRLQQVLDKLTSVR